MFKEISCGLTLISLALSLLPIAGDEVEFEPTKGFTIAYVAPAEERRVSTHAIIDEPQEFRVKQSENDLEVQVRASVVSVAARPVELPDKLQKSVVSQLLKHSAEAKKNIETGPLLGPDRVFILFDRERFPRYVVETYGLTLVTSECKFVSPTLEVKEPNSPLHEQHEKAVFTIGDLFQKVPDTETFVLNGEIVEFLQSLPSPIEGSRTPFRKWIIEKGKGAQKLGGGGD